MSRMEKFVQAMGDDAAWWIVLVMLSGAGASLLGLSMLLRSGAVLTLRAVVGASLHSLVWGITIFLLCYSTFRSDLPMLVGLSIMSGLGSASLLDMVLMLIKHRFGISISINPPTPRKDS